MQWNRRVLLAVTAGAILACAHTPPQELVDARLKMQDLRDSPAPELAPVASADAEKALYEANSAWASDQNANEGKDLAYVAIRRVERAQAATRGEQAKRERAAAMQQIRQTDETLRAQLQAQLGQTREK